MHRLGFLDHVWTHVYKSGEGEILTGVERVVMGTNGTILLESPNKSHITSHITKRMRSENSLIEIEILKLLAIIKHVNVSGKDGAS